MEPFQEVDKVKKKITQLLLNTPGACFLCLQDNEKYEGIPDHLNGGIIDLSTICRYLNISQCSLLLTSLQNIGGSGVEDLEQDECTFSVNLCGKCMELTEKLNDKIIALRKAKLMVNYQLHSFHQLLEEKSEELIDLQEKMSTNSDNSMEAKLVQRLREEVKEKSSKFLKKAEAAMPEILLSKCPVPPLQRKQFDHPPPSSPPLSEAPHSFTSSVLPSSPEPPPSSAPLLVPSCPPAGSPPSIKTLLNQLVTTSVLPSKKSRKSKPPLHRCPYCAKIMTHSKFPLHLCCLHSDKLLSSYFLPPSQPPSEQICRQVLQTKMIGNPVKIQSSTPSSRSRWACHLCGISHGHSSLLKHHFLLSHTTQLCEEIKFRKMSASKNSQLPKSVIHFIKQLMETSLINPSNDNIDNAAKVIKRHGCPFCGISFDSSHFALHLANLHPDQLLDPFTPSIDKNRDDNPNYFSQLCSTVLATQVAKAATIRSTSSSSSSSRYSRKLCCHLCTSKYSEGRHLKYHFLVHHTDDLCEQLIKFENSKGEVQDKKKRKLVIKKGKPLKKKMRLVEGKTCTICNIVFPQFDKLRRHQATHHPDQLFLECKPDWMGGDQFRETCEGMFRREVGKASCGGKYLRCGYCPEGKRSYGRQRDLIVHLTYQHRREMEEILKQDCEEKQENEQDDRGDHMVIEEDASEFDVKAVEIGELELGSGELIVERQYGNFEEEQLESPDNQSASSSSSQVIKMEVN